MKFYYAMICLSVGGFLGYQVKRRQHKRTNATGQEEFPSFSTKVAETALENIVWGSAIVLIVVGAFNLIAA